MQVKRVGLIGFGAIGKSIVDTWSRAPVTGHRLTALLVREHQVAEAKALVPRDVAVTSGIDELLALAPEIVIEAAGHAAVVQHAERVLCHETRLLMLSVGGLADPSLYTRLEQAACAGGVQVVLPVGAIAGIDGLLALRRAGLRRVRYSSTKPPKSWLGTPAEQDFDLLALASRTVIFEGTARDAARCYPKNANLAATVAMAGLGFEQTTVQLIADPDATGNVGHIDAEGDFSRLEVTVSSRSSSGNPKTSRITGMSVLSALTNEASVISFG
ncbi:MAG: aspartate dehydrogenase [Burkholderiales bacterium]|nr:aspartate dehydrogenase [Burkholderiales bacterium]